MKKTKMHGPLIVTTINIEPELLKRAQEHAAAKEHSFSGLVRWLLKEDMKKALDKGA